MSNFGKHPEALLVNHLSDSITCETGLMGSVAGATHRGISTWCLAPNSATKPNMLFLRVGRIARHEVQAGRLPVPG
jgi:hypothetical protein